MDDEDEIDRVENESAESEMSIDQDDIPEEEIDLGYMFPSQNESDESSYSVDESTRS